MFFKNINLTEEIVKLTWKVMLLDLQISPEKVKGCSLKDLSWGTCMVGELDEDLHVAFHASLNACRKRHDVYNYEKHRKNHG